MMISVQKDEVYEIRRKYVMKYSQLIQGDYEPDKDIFGQIESGKPWWGILGISYYGPRIFDIPVSLGEFGPLRQEQVRKGLDQPSTQRKTLDIGDAINPNNLRTD